MAYTHISANDTNGSVNTSSFAINTPTAGNLLVVFINWINASSGLTVNTNNSSGTAWTINSTNLNYYSSDNCYFAYTIATGSEVGVYIGSVGTTAFYNYSEYSGNQSSLTGIEDAGPNTSTSGGSTVTTLTTANISTATSNDLIVAGIATQGSNGSTSLTWTNGFTGSAVGSGARTAMAYYISTGTVSGLNTNGTWATSRDAGSLIMAFKPTSGGGGGTPGTSNNQFFALF